MKKIVLLSLLSLLFSCSRKTPEEFALKLGEMAVREHLRADDSIVFEKAHVVARKEFSLIDSNGKREIWILHYDIKNKNSSGVYLQQSYCAYTMTEPNNLEQHFGGNVQVFSCNRGHPNDQQLNDIQSRVHWLDRK